MRSKQLQQQDDLTVVLTVGTIPHRLSVHIHTKLPRGQKSVQTADRITEKEQQKKKGLMETNTWNQCDTETDGVRSALYLTVDVGASVQQHLDHGLVPAHAGVHERGHPLWEKQEEELQAGGLQV